MINKKELILSYGLAEKAYNHFEANESLGTLSMRDETK
jgi:hypothetical protein